MHIPTTFFLILVILLIILLKELLFRQNTYHNITGNSYLQTIWDKGRYGEYLTYRRLKAYESDGGKFLFNCYLPKTDGKTTEIDVLLIHSTGIFVIESKNYSGWIFGKETAPQWTQTLPNGRGKTRKEHFYNPIKQNDTHIKWLTTLVGRHIPLYSVIAFSERCTLKDITITRPDVKVINRQHIHKTIKNMGNHSIQALSRMDIARIYEMLYPYTQVSASVKSKHIDDVNKQKHRNTGKQPTTAQTVQNAKCVSMYEQTVTHVMPESTAESTQTSSIAAQQTTLDTLSNAPTVTAQQAMSETSQNAPTSLLQDTSDISRNTSTIMPQPAPVLSTKTGSDKTPPDSARNCPRCGSALTLRTAKKGQHAGHQFYGCSRFPKCRYNEPIELKKP